jgi:DHA1 family inner membrane transport protein
MPVLLAGIMLLILIFLAMPFLELTVVPAVGMVLVWGCIHFAAGAPLQSRIVDQAKGAPNLASTLNQGAFNLGNALGASLGGIMLTAGIGYRYLSLGSAAVASVALVVALIALRVEQKENGPAEKNEMVSV